VILGQERLDEPAQKERRHPSDERPDVRQGRPQQVRDLRACGPPSRSAPRPGQPGLSRDQEAGISAAAVGRKQPRRNFVCPSPHVVEHDRPSGDALLERRIEFPDPRSCRRPRQIESPPACCCVIRGGGTSTSIRAGRSRSEPFLPLQPVRGLSRDRERHERSSPPREARRRRREDAAPGSEARTEKARRARGRRAKTCGEEAPGVSGAAQAVSWISPYAAHSDSR